MKSEISKFPIELIKDRLIEAYSPSAIYIFGSYAWGNPTEDSDLDLAVVVKNSNQKKYKRSVLGHEVLSGLHFSKDIVVYTEDEFQNSQTEKSSLCYKIEHEAIQIL